MFPPNLIPQMSRLVEGVSWERGVYEGGEPRSARITHQVTDHLMGVVVRLGNMRGRTEVDWITVPTHVCVCGWVGVGG